MLKKYLKKVHDMMIQPSKVDPASFDDPVAMKTDWYPLQGSHGSSSFKSHTLKEIGNWQIMLAPSTASRTFAMLFMGFSLVFILVSLFITSSWEKAIPFLVGGTVFFLIGLLILIFRRSSIFDLRERVFYRAGRVAHNPKRLKHYVKLDDVHALQILKERERSKNNVYDTYEINLVLKTGEREHVVQHGDKESIYQDAQVIARKLDVPLWNGVA